MMSNVIRRGLTVKRVRCKKAAGMSSLIQCISWRWHVQLKSTQSYLSRICRVPFLRPARVNIVRSLAVYHVAFSGTQIKIAKLDINGADLVAQIGGWLVLEPFISIRML